MVTAIVVEVEVATVYVMAPPVLFVIVKEVQ